jgi:hypothetical protein
MPQVWQLKWMTLEAGFMWRRTSSLGLVMEFLVQESMKKWENQS